MGKVCCEVCHKRCKGNVLKAGDKYFHKDCFKCSECKCSLKAGGFFMKNEKYFCQKDYHKFSSPKCKVCGEVLRGDIVSALSYSFHKGCFICSQCKTPFNPGNRVTVWKDEFYCVCCSQSLGNRHFAEGGKILTSPSSLNQDDGKKQHLKQSQSQYRQMQPQQQRQQQHRLSFADHPSPASITDGSGESGITPMLHKTNGSILKSSLRQSHTVQPVSSASNGGNSDLGDPLPSKFGRFSEAINVYSLAADIFCRDAPRATHILMKCLQVLILSRDYSSALNVVLKIQTLILDACETHGYEIEMFLDHLTETEVYRVLLILSTLPPKLSEISTQGPLSLAVYIGEPSDLGKEDFTPYLEEELFLQLKSLIQQQQQQKAGATLPVGLFQGQPTRTSIPTSRTFSPQHSQSLQGSGRHPLSEYGRFYNLSYVSIAEQPSRRSTDVYRRIPLHTPATSNSTSHLQHFHIPQGNRFPLEPNRIVPAGLSHTSRTFNTSLRDALMAQRASTGRLTVVPTSSASINGGNDPEVDENKRSTLVESEAASLEARRLASFPSGQPPDATSVPAIERYDWPAPASTAVMTAEIMRERRQRLREQGVLQTSSEESVEDLSIDASVGSHGDLDRVPGGIGRAILMEEERARRRKTRSTHPVDPVSASRSPNAKVEPPYKTRYATHNFASPSRENHHSSVSPHRLGYSLELVNLGNRMWTASDYYHCHRNEIATRNSAGLRPGYTAGQLSLPPTKTSTIPGSHCFSSPHLDISQTGEQTNGKVNGQGPIQSQLSPIRTNLVNVNGNASTSSRDFDTSLLGSTPSYPSVVSSTPYTVFSKHEESCVKEIPYKDLVANLGRPPKGIDRTRLEMYLSDVEFERVFQLSRVAFYRLPEWKRNDLKRRVDLF